MNCNANKKVNLLFYVDPIIEKGSPYFKEGWANYFCFDIIKTIKNSVYKDNYNFNIILNEPLAEKFLESDYVDNVIIISQKELLEVFDWDALKATIVWQKEEYNKKQMKCYCNLFKNKLGKFKPDVIMTFSNVPFLKRLYPDALVLYREYGIFSRKPFPETWYMDIYGMHGAQYLNKNYDSIKPKCKLSLENQKYLHSFKSKIVANIKLKSPFKHIVDDFKKTFSKAVLLPLYPNTTYYFQSMTKYNNQIQLLFAVLETIPNDVAVVVTTHPDYNFLNSSLISYLKIKYPNFIYEREFENYYSPTQYLIDGVDAVITISTSLALQTLIWDKKLITLNDSFLSCISDGNDINQIKKVLSKQYENKDDILFWCLTRYFVSARYLYDANWFNNFIRNALVKFRNGHKVEFYESMDDEKIVLSNLLKDCDWNIPQKSTSYSYDRLKELYNDEVEKYNDEVERYSDLVNKINTKTKIIDYLKENEKIFIKNVYERVKGNVIFIWGAGNHTNKLIDLFEKYRFNTDKIKGIIDGKSNSNLKYIKRIKVYKYEEFMNDELKDCTDIIISSASYEKEILAEMDDMIKKTCNIITLYDKNVFRVLL